MRTKRREEKLKEEKKREVWRSMSYEHHPGEQWWINPSVFKQLSCALRRSFPKQKVARPRMKLGRRRKEKHSK